MAFIFLLKQFQRYYISPDGNDGNSGTSEAFPWKTRANVVSGAASFKPGDQFLLKAGAEFAGPFNFINGPGNNVWPNVFTSYGGSDKPVITSLTDEYGLYVEGCVAQVRGLRLAGPGNNSFSVGINFEVGTKNGRLYGPLIDDVEVSGYLAGIAIGCDPVNFPGAGTGWFDGLSVTGSLCHDNQVYGLWSYGHSTAFGDGIYRIRNFIVDDVECYDNPGTATQDPSYGTAPGFSIEAAQTGVVKNCLSARNGKRGAGGASGVGIQTINADGITIQDNEVHSSRITTDTDNDGLGIDFDENTKNSTIERNFVHDCDGAGLIAFSPVGIGSVSDNKIRENIAVNNGALRRNGSADLVISGDASILNLEVYNNTFYNSVALNVVQVNMYSGGTMSGVQISNNIIHGGLSPQLLLQTLGNPSGISFTKNDWYNGGGATNVFEWNSISYTSLTLWQTVTGQEKISGSNVGLTSNPLLVNPGGTTATDYKLQAGSPMIDAGLDLAAQYGFSVGTTDYFSGTKPLGSGYDVGAHEKA